MFKTKTIPYTSLGDRLKTIRQRRGLSLQEVSRETRIQGRYLGALEGGNYEELPKGFVERYLRQYARLLRVNEEKALAWFRVETLSFRSETPTTPASAPVETKPPLVIPFLVRKVGLFLLLAMFVTYLGNEIYGVLAPPLLTIQSPSEDWMTSEHRVTIAGKTAPESLVMMNGQEVAIDEQGQFNQELALSDGVNVIRIEARKDQGRANVIYRKILVQPL